MLFGLHVQHEGGECAFEARELAFQQHKARTAHLGGRLEIHHAEGLAEIGMVLHLEIIGFRLAPAGLLDIAVFVLAFGHFIQRDVRQAIEQIVEQLAGGFFLLASGLDRVLGVGHDLAQALELRLITRGFGPADQLGGLVAQLFGFLLVGHSRADGAVMRKNIIHGIAKARLLPVPGGAESLGVFADGADVEHVRGPV